MTDTMQLNEAAMPKRQHRGRHRTSEKADLAYQRLVDMAAAGEPLPLTAQALADLIGTSRNPARMGLARYQVRREVEAEFKRESEPVPVEPVDVTSFSYSQRIRYERAVSQIKWQLEKTFEDRVQAEIRRRVEDFVLPSYRETESHWRAVIKARKGIMTRDLFRRILASLHPDRSMSNETLAEVFQAFREMELALVSEKELPTPQSTLPKTVEELLARRRK